MDEDRYCIQKHPPEVFLRKDVLKICRKFTGEHHAEVRYQQSYLQHY